MSLLELMVSLLELMVMSLLELMVMSLLELMVMSLLDLYAMCRGAIEPAFCMWFLNHF